MALRKIPHPCMASFFWTSFYGRTFIPSMPFRPFSALNGVKWRVKDHNAPSIKIFSQSLVCFLYILSNSKQINWQFIHYNSTYLDHNKYLDSITVQYGTCSKKSFIYKKQTKLCEKNFMLGVLWSFYPRLNTVKCWKRMEGHRSNENSFEGHRRKFKKKRPYKEEVFF